MNQLFVPQHATTVRLWRLFVVALVTAVVATVAAAASHAAPLDNPVIPPNDAGSGRDAGVTFETAVGVEPGVIYNASLNNTGAAFPVVGDYDRFTFDVRAGQVINAEVGGGTNVAACMWLIAPDGETLSSGPCGGGVVTGVAPIDGVYALEYGYEVAGEAGYTFGIGLDEPTPQRDVDMGTPTDTSPGLRPSVVVAVADTGVNPYHELYYRPAMTQHPCTWVEGFDDCSIPALDLSIGEYDTFAEAYAADQEVWASVQPAQWYWIPKTNIIGAVCDVPLVGQESAVCILDEDGHGTGTTSAVLSEAPDALLLVHEGSSAARNLETAPVIPDVQSHSWGPDAPLPAHAADPVTRPVLGYGLADPGAYDAETLFFIAAGNQAPFPTILDRGRVHPAVQVVGGGYPGFASLRSWSTYDFASWVCRPVAMHDAVAGVRPNACGTSFAGPTAAGTAAAALLEIRRAEGTTQRSTADMVSTTVSRDQFVAALRAGATYAPQGDRFANRPEATDVALQPGREHLAWGYGWLDRTRIDAIVTCALDGVCPAKSADAEEYNATRQEIRRRSTEPALPPAD